MPRAKRKTRKESERQKLAKGIEKDILSDAKPGRKKSRLRNDISLPTASTTPSTPSKKTKPLNQRSVLTKQQEAFAISYARSGDVRKAAKEAGYSVSSAVSNFSKLTKNALVVSRIRAEFELMFQEQRDRFRLQADKAQDCLDKVMSGAHGVDPKMAMAMVQAANSVLDRSGFKPSDRLRDEGPQVVKIEVGLIQDRGSVPFPSPQVVEALPEKEG